MTSVALQQVRRRVIVGVDTHKYVHVAVALDDHAAVIESREFSADRAGYASLIDWAGGLGSRVTFAIEGTGSYGAGLTAAVRSIHPLVCFANRWNGRPSRGPAGSLSDRSSETGVGTWPELRV